MEQKGMVSTFKKSNKYVPHYGISENGEKLPRNSAQKKSVNVKLLPGKLIPIRKKMNIKLWKIYHLDTQRGGWRKHRGRGKLDAHAPFASLKKKNDDYKRNTMNDFGLKFQKYI